MAYLTRDDVLKSDDLEREEVPVSEWGGVLLVRAMNGAERDRLEMGMVKQNGDKVSVNLINLRAKIVAMSAIDENGKHIFSESDVAELAKKSGAALDRVVDVCRRLSGLSDKEVKALTSNLSLTQSEGLTS